MSNGEHDFEMTMRSKAALDAGRAVKKYLELIKSGEDHTTAFLQMFCNIFYVVPPQPRPDYIMSLNELYDANKDALAHYKLLEEEAEQNLKFLEDVLSVKPNKPE